MSGVEAIQGGDSMLSYHHFEKLSGLARSSSYSNKVSSTWACGLPLFVEGRAITIITGGGSKRSDCSSLELFTTAKASTTVLVLSSWSLASMILDPRNSFSDFFKLLTSSRMTPFLWWKMTKSLSPVLGTLSDLGTESSLLHRLFHLVISVRSNPWMTNMPRFFARPFFCRWSYTSFSPCLPLILTSSSSAYLPSFEIV